jgi:2-alkyl-3-oxoalkanoate reductase
MPILVTGATGFLGSHVAEQLAHSGQECVALVRKSSDTSFLKTLPGVRFAVGSVEDRDSVRRAMEGVDAVIHVAGLVKAKSDTEFRRVNAGGTENVVSAAVEHGVKRMVLVSSQAVGGPSEKGGAPVRVGQERAPVTTYGRTKLAAERAVLAQKDKLHSVILRPPAIYGPRDNEVLVFFKAVKSGVLPLTNPIDAEYSMIYGPDCAKACILALHAQVPSGSTYYLEDGQPITFGDMIRLVEQALGKRAWMRIPLPAGLVRTAAMASEMYGKFADKAVMLTVDKCNELHASSWVCDGEPARRDLGFEPQYNFAEGVKHTARWYQQNGWL